MPNTYKPAIRQATKGELAIREVEKLKAGLDNGAIKALLCKVKPSMLVTEQEAEDNEVWRLARLAQYKIWLETILRME